MANNSEQCLREGSDAALNVMRLLLVLILEKNSPEINTRLSHLPHYITNWCRKF